MDIPMTQELSKICGIHAGDDHLRDRKTKIELDITGHLEESEYYQNHVFPLFNSVFGLDLKSRGYSKGSYGFVTTNLQFKIFKELGFPYGKKSLIVRVPPRIIRSKNKIFYARFLRGIFDTDGNLYFMNRKTENSYGEFKKNHNYYPVIRLRTISNQLIKGASCMLKELGIKHFIFGHQSKKKNEKRVYTLVINGSERLEKWMEIIGIKNPVKLTRYLIWKKFGFCPPGTTLKQREDILNDKLDIYSLGS